MVTAVDTNVLLDLLYADAPQHASSESALEEAGGSDTLIVGEVVCAELASQFGNTDALQAFLASLDVAITRSSFETLRQAGVAFAGYSRRRRRIQCAECGSAVDVSCPRCGAAVTGRQHILPDFMIGAHAQVHAGRLLTRDRGFYAKYFPELDLV